MLPTASLTISELFSNPFLLDVPVYQRPYSWGEEQAEQLFDDLLEASSLGIDEVSDPGYFLGTILLMDASGSDATRLTAKTPARTFDVVDGQQRLVTLMTLFAVLRDLETSLKRPISRRVQGMFVAQQGARFFRTERFRLHLAARDKSWFEEFVLQADSTQLVPTFGDMSASDEALYKVRERLKRLAKEISEADRERLFSYISAKCHVVVIVSNDIDRAHQLFIVLNERGKHLQRNDIIKVDLLSGMSKADLAWADEKWNETSAMLGDDFEQFFAHIRTIYGHARPKIVSGVRSVIQEAGGADAFFKTVLLPLAEAYALIRSCGEGVLPPEMSRHLFYLNRLADGDWAPAAMWALKDWKRDPERAAQLLAEIDRFAHLMRLLCAGSGKRLRKFAGVIAALRSDELARAGHPMFQISREELRNISFHMRDLHKRNPKACKLLLLRLSDEISGTIADVNPDHYTIEHVLPQRPSATSEWRKWFPTPEERSQSVECLGNLALITQQQNDRARNASWSAKKDIYSAANVKTPLLAITRDVLDAHEWRSSDIEAREKRLLGIIEKIWRVDLSGTRSSTRADASKSDITLGPTSAV
ncbi:MAG: hypothetical protein CTY31_00625 [Hyphomicrobium sp.]|nr:MAG: hypothetical protein CTY31_00625 [Hyphomicrobium sp.]